MTDLLPPNKTPLEQALSLTGDLAILSPSAIKTLWNPQTCPKEFLPFLAWTFSVDYWNDAWPEETKRNIIASSLAIHRQKGTVAAVKSAVAAFNVAIDIEQWFQVQPNRTPHTFKVLFANNQNKALLSPELYHNICVAIENSKPVRSHFVVQVQGAFSTPLKIGMAVQTHVRVVVGGVIKRKLPKINNQLNIGMVVRPVVLVLL